MLQYLVIALILAGVMFYLGRRFYGVVTGRGVLRSCADKLKKGGTGNGSGETSVKSCAGSCEGCAVSRRRSGH